MDDQMKGEWEGLVLAVFYGFHRGSVEYDVALQGSSSEHRWSHCYANSLTCSWQASLRRTSGNANVQRYAQMVRADRELKLAGYEVFRFGAAELQSTTSKTDVKTFFEALFKPYGVAIV